MTLTCFAMTVMKPRLFSLSISICLRKNGTPPYFFGSLMTRYKMHNFLTLGLTPGPVASKDRDSFIIPFLTEMECLHVGITAWAVRTNSAFLLRVYVVFAMGDTPVIYKLLYFSGHNAKSPCRICER
jgi:hypothetical protein